jgi:SAM-dependent methyltransferase
MPRNGRVSVREASADLSLGHISQVREFFDRQYGTHDRYWWRGGNRYSTQPADHTRFNAAWLAEAARRGSGRALDVGAGEGADAIRLARVGYTVDLIEISAVACEKAEKFARAEGINLNVRNEPIERALLAARAYDLVLMNGCLHYVHDKAEVLRRVRAASAPGSVHAVALFSTATPVPPEHAAIPVFPDDEGGIVERFYADGWRVLQHGYYRGQEEHSHPGFGPHAHSHVKLVVASTSSQGKGTNANSQRHA